MTVYQRTVNVIDFVGASSIPKQGVVEKCICFNMTTTRANLIHEFVELKAYLNVFKTMFKATY